MIYPPNERSFDRALFANPPAEYRGVPFWSWNCAVTMDKIRPQVECFRQMGMGGVMVHPRTGLDTEYLSEEYMALVSGTEEELRARGMSCWLYDEERFPSGCAGGIVTQDVRYRARYIVLTQTPRPHFPPDYAAFCEAAARGEKPAGYYLCSYDVELTKGRLTRYERRAQGGPWYAYVELWPESPWFNGASYVDVFNAEAVDRFLEVTHARYAKALGEHIGKTVPAIFTDEPHMKGKHNLPTASPCWISCRSWSGSCRTGTACIATIIMSTCPSALPPPMATASAHGAAVTASPIRGISCRSGRCSPRRWRWGKR